MPDTSPVTIAAIKTTAIVSIFNKKPTIIMTMPINFNHSILTPPFYVSAFKEHTTVFTEMKDNPFNEIKN
ncbi:hypothetical protein HpBTM60_09450 [Helicobacter pylori]